MEPYLIQRGRFKVDGKPTGYDALVQNDYMGSSEFEFGALSASLKAITSSLDQYTINATDLKQADGRGLFIICLNDVKDQVTEILVKLSKDERKSFFLEEPTYLKNALNQTKWNGRLSSAAGTELWWDIGNHWIACLGKDKAELLLKGLEALRIRWKNEGKI
jgi:hypothetical protein